MMTDTLTLTNRRKVSDFPRITKLIAELFAAGDKYTAIELNQLTQHNDARKIISDLRKAGFPIVAQRLPDGRNLYYMEKGGEQ